ncbi:MAG: hypothetical protein KAS12_00135, partial [Candidatus Aenigmarchaeota archaeon]|nr:hypothetical protein [Candidatus Aenigmarchaeota archaeon]
AILILMCGIYRLARFNVIKKQKTFTGLPIPAIGAIIASFVLALELFVTIQITTINIAIILVIAALLMVSKIPYPIITNLDSKNMRLFLIIGVIFTVVVFLVNPAYFVIAPFMYYVILGTFSAKK